MTSTSGRPPIGGVVVGLDIGGSKTHGVLWRDGEKVAEAASGSANVQNVTPAEAAGHLLSLFTVLADPAAPGHQPVHRVIAGSGGVDTSDDVERLRALIAPHAPEATIEILHDTRLILAAGRVAEGIAVIAGTGSVAWGVAGGIQARSGGWGYLLGDEGSGYWVAREAARATLHRADLGLPQDELGRLVLRRNALESPAGLIGLFHSSAGRTYWASQSPLVFDAAALGEPVAMSIIRRAADALASLVLDVASVIRSNGPVVIGGGLAVNQPLLQEALRASLSGQGFDAVAFLAQDPVMGVEFLLRQ
ncbi:BadF/BadG/BcrA/BcrD ATPase family protein [Arthrobacter sp. Br18]|uniref:N-acetylglucosamine kinase n=1 Tax=Arthrobacter sp. Br18 TaxID=1312954 RepID=UPI00047A4CAB|nr:BadF/BadG/BcrA/BcrD ATPase family protein [Arthrobacter sp. Br18]